MIKSPKEEFIIHERMYPKILFILLIQSKKKSFDFDRGELHSTSAKEGFNFLKINPPIINAKKTGIAT